MAEVVKTAVKIVERNMKGTYLGGMLEKLLGTSKTDQVINQIDKVDSRTFTISSEMKKSPLYRMSNRDKSARTIIDKFKKEAKLTSKNNIVPGQLVMFKYLNPKNMEDLEYYDAAPCTIFFSRFNSSEGPRVLGFNVHYLPPQIRMRILDAIYKMFRPVYKKYFETGVQRELDGFDYQFLTDELRKHDLDFAVREYIPSLIGDTYIVPPKLWPTALFTEGWFKKETRAAIMKHFKTDAKSKHKISTGAHSKHKGEDVFESKKKKKK